MGTKTTRLDLLKPGENDYYNQQTEQADNWQKVDDYAVYTDRDKNGIWGGLDGGGLIEDPSVTKVVGRRYIGADGKDYICLVPSNINNSTNYMPCNTVDNLNKLQNLSTGIASNVLTVQTQGNTPINVATTNNNYTKNITIGENSLTIQKNGLYNIKFNAITYQDTYVQINVKINNVVLAAKGLDATSGDGAASSRCFVIDTLAELKKDDIVTFGLSSYRSSSYKNVNYSMLLVSN